MKIQVINPTSMLLKYEKTQKQAPAYTQVEQGDELRLSEEGKAFAMAVRMSKSGAATITGSRQAHIENLTRQVQSGTYSVDPSVLARRMLDALDK